MVGQFVQVFNKQAHITQASLMRKKKIITSRNISIRRRSVVAQQTEDRAAESHIIDLTGLQVLGHMEPTAAARIS
jgi:hypothetical protein